MKKTIVGIDEAGRGPLAGPVYAACVILNQNKKIKGLNDSKKLTANQRNELFQVIIEYSSAYGIGYATNEEIDSINILQASFLAMKRALMEIKATYNYILVDGNIYPFNSICDGRAIIKGDTKIEEIMAASILAKVSRDSYMSEVSRIYPEYQFSKHKGYPTHLHKELIKNYGPCLIHRKTFRGVKEFCK